MEQIGAILRERVEELHRLEQRVSLSRTEAQMMKDCLRELLKTKKQEKIRAAKEQDVLEIIFSSRSINKQQRIVFERVAYEVMKSIYPKLEVRTVFNGKMPSILELFTSFFIALDLKQKANEILKIFSNNLCNKFSFICLLLNILIDTVRKRLMSFIKAEADELTKSINKSQNKRDQGIPLQPQQYSILSQQNVQQQQQLMQRQQQINANTNTNNVQGRITKGDNSIDNVKTSNLLVNSANSTINKTSRGILNSNSNVEENDPNTISRSKNNKNGNGGQNQHSEYNFVFDNINRANNVDQITPSSPTKLKDTLKSEQEQSFKLSINENKQIECQSTLSSQRGGNLTTQMQRPIPISSAVNQILGANNTLSPSKKIANIIIQQRPQNHFTKQRVISQNASHQNQMQNSSSGAASSNGHVLSCPSTSQTQNSVPKRHTSLKNPPNGIGNIINIENSSLQQNQQSSANMENNQNNYNFQGNNNQNTSNLNNNNLKQRTDSLQRDGIKINWNEIYTLINQQGGSNQFNIKYQNSQYNQTTRDFFGMFFPRFMENYKNICTVITELDVYYPYQMKLALKKTSNNPKEWAATNMNNILMCMLVKNSNVKSSITKYAEQYNSFKNKKKHHHSNSTNNNNINNTNSNSNNIINTQNNNNNDATNNKSKTGLSTQYSKTMNQIPQNSNEQAKNEPNYLKALKRDSIRQYQQQGISSQSQPPKSLDLSKQSYINSNNTHQKAVSSCYTIQNFKQTTQTMQTQQSYLNYEDQDTTTQISSNITKLPAINPQQPYQDYSMQHPQTQVNEKGEQLNVKDSDQNIQSYAFEDTAILQQNNNYQVGNSQLSQLRVKQRNHQQRSISEYRSKLNQLNNSELNGNNNAGDMNERHIRLLKQQQQNYQKKNSSYQPDSYVNILNTYSNQDILLQTNNYSPNSISRRFNLTQLAYKNDKEEETEQVQKKKKEELSLLNQKIKELQKNIQLTNMTGITGIPNNNAGYLQNLSSFRQKQNKSEMNTPIKQRIVHTNRAREYSYNGQNININNSNNSNSNSNSNNNQTMTNFIQKSSIPPIANNSNSIGNLNNNNNQNSNVNLSNSNAVNNFNMSVLNTQVNESYNSASLNKSVGNTSSQKINYDSNVPNISYMRQISKFMQRSYNQPLAQLEEIKLKHQQLTESIMQDSYPLLHINNSKKLIPNSDHSQSTIIPNSHLYPSLSKLSMYQQYQQ